MYKIHVGEKDNSVPSLTWLFTFKGGSYEPPRKETIPLDRPYERLVT